MNLTVAMLMILDLLLAWIIAGSKWRVEGEME